MDTTAEDNKVDRKLKKMEEIPLDVNPVNLFEDCEIELKFVPREDREIMIDIFKGGKEEIERKISFLRKFLGMENEENN